MNRQELERRIYRQARVGDSPEELLRLCRTYVECCDHERCSAITQPALQPVVLELDVTCVDEEVVA